MSILAYADEIVPPTEVDELNGLDDVTVADREVKMAEMLVESLTASFDPDKYHDDYRVQVLDLIARKAAGEEFELPAGANAPPKIVDMMAALEASVEAAKAARKRHPTAREAPAAGAAKKAAARPRSAKAKAKKTA
jgi:DNA end-binding protein Ku